jgi:hypothetical protein
MDSKHAKSPCCGARIRHFGPRRRQCVACKRTWRVRPRRRGRRRHRTALGVLHRVLVEGFTLHQLGTTSRGVTLPACQYRFRQALRRFVARPSPQALPPGPLLLLVDGLWFQFAGHPWVLYLTALRACRGHRAVFLDPLLLPGQEGASRWRRAVAAIPPATQRRIRGFVADDLPGMRRIAREHGWVFQLCHFHLLLRLRGPRPRGRPHTPRRPAVRAVLDHLVRQALTLPEGRCLEQTLAALQRLTHRDCGTLRTQRTVRQFLQHIDDYRAYLAQPALQLPRTTSAVESMARLLRELFRSSRAGCNPRSVLLWATALIRLRPQVTCNGSCINRIS